MVLRVIKFSTLPPINCLFRSVHFEEISSSFSHDNSHSTGNPLFYKSIMLMLLLDDPLVHFLMMRTLLPLLQMMKVMMKEF
jgi:hypothetical protein